MTTVRYTHEPNLEHALCNSISVDEMCQISQFFSDLMRKAIPKLPPQTPIKIKDVSEDEEEIELHQTKGFFSPQVGRIDSKFRIKRKP
jgi:hypothetical protein